MLRNVGSLSFNSSTGGDGQEVVDELATLLTSGRISQQRKEELYSAFEERIDNRDGAVNFIQQLIILMPEFHSTGIARHKASLRALPSTNRKTCKAYKAVVHIMLYGGVDSFNILVPFSGCRKGGEFIQIKLCRTVPE